MARVILNIEAESATDLQNAINDLARGGAEHRLVGAEPAQQRYVPEDRPEQIKAEGPPAEPEQPKKRKRRTKAEIEADKKAHDEKQAERTAAESDTNVVNLQPAPEPEPAVPENPTRQDVDAAMKALLDLNGGAQMLELLKDLDAVNEQGQTKISALDEAKYAEAIQKAQEITARLKADAEQGGGVLG